jgi:hypothetical protein
MHRDPRENRIVLAAALLLIFFSIPHLIDDFLFGVPEEFGLGQPFALILAGVFAVILVLSVVGVALCKRAGYVASLVMGIFLSLAGLLKHLPGMIKPGPYWSGWLSELLILGVIVSGLLLAGVSLRALHRYEA